MDVAIDLFVKKGYDGASLNEILATAGFGKSSYYYYFADKEDLFATVIEDFIARVDTEVPRLSLETLDRETFWPVIEAYLRTVVRTATHYPHMIALSRDIRTWWRNPSPRLRPLVDAVAAQQRATLERGRVLGTIRTDIDVDWLLAITEAADQAVDERLLASPALGPADFEEHVRVVMDTFRRLAEPRTKG
jgi:AcrR family transcriptional regulator